MPWYSILPPQLIYLESWAAKVFFALGLVTIIPWAVLLAFDLVLYISRMSLYELPVWSGDGGGSGGRRARAARRDGAGRGTGTGDPGSNDGTGGDVKGEKSQSQTQAQTQYQTQAQTTGLG
ncbi:hypothetical protein PHISP_01334 [Aspergillus sp. HF37]|nr:hypothetical protein PHISP_01334 [Aspergillus sp. HF37]